jgi:hypothetical protein
VQQIGYLAETKSAPIVEHFYILKLVMVQHIDPSWNHIKPSLTLMYQKLVDLGFVYYGGKVQIIEPETKKSEYHTSANSDRNQLPSQEGRS